MAEIKASLPVYPLQAPMCCRKPTHTHCNGPLRVLRMCTLAICLFNGLGFIGFAANCRDSFFPATVLWEYGSVCAWTYHDIVHGLCFYTGHSVWLVGYRWFLIEVRFAFIFWNFIKMKEVLCSFVKQVDSNWVSAFAVMSDWSFPLCISCCISQAKIYWFTANPRSWRG